MSNFDDVFSHDVEKFCWLGREKATNIYNELNKAKNLDGNTAEIGVYLGGTSKFIHKMSPNKIHYCYDTFAGIQGADSNHDQHIDGDFSCSLEDVKTHIDMDDVVYKVGYFPDTFTEEHEKFCFVHSDTDTYIGTKNTLLYFCDKIVQGGKIFFDDYNWPACVGVQTALHEFRETDTLFEHANYKYQYVLTKK